MTNFSPAITAPITCKEVQTPLGTLTVTFAQTWFTVSFDGEVIQDSAHLTDDQTLIAWPSRDQMARFGLPGKIIVKMDNIPAPVANELERKAEWGRDLAAKRNTFDSVINEGGEGYNPYR